MNTTFEEASRLMALRERLFRCVEDELDKGDGHKSYEGALEVTMSFPSIFERGDPPTWVITWHCYVVPETGRQLTWTGPSLMEALAVAENDANRICFPYEMARFENQHAPDSDSDFEWAGS